MAFTEKFGLFSNKLEPGAVITTVGDRSHVTYSFSEQFTFTKEAFSISFYQIYIAVTG
jgi:hypothetical protein